MKHTCHATGCTIEVPRDMLMCKHHWFMVPKDIRARVWKYFTPGQCVGGSIDEEWIQAARDAVNAVADRTRSTR